MLALLPTLLASTFLAPAALLPNGILSSGQGLAGNLEVGAARVAGHTSPMNQMEARGAFAYAPRWLAVGFLEVESTQPADSMVLTRSRIGLSPQLIHRDSAGLVSLMTPELSWWTQTFHLDTGSRAIEIEHSGIEARLGLGLGGIGTRQLQGGLGVSACLRSALIGPQKARPELVLRCEGSVGWSLQELFDVRRAFSQGIGIYLRQTIQWSPYPLDPASGTGRPFALPRWQYGLRAGVTALL